VSASESFPVEPKPEAASPKRFALAEWSFGGLLALALVGIGVTDFSSGDGLRYWLFVAPVFAVVSTAADWSRARASGENAPSIVRRQILHWVALAPALAVVYAFEQTGRLNREDAGLVSLLALALTTILAGVHFDWRLAVLGAVLGLTSLAAAVVEEFFWMLLIPIVLAGGVYVLWRRRAHARPAPLTTEKNET
jgi:hypothetical protein